MGEWHTILIDGDERATRGFVSGFVGDRQIDASQVVFAADVGVPPESLGERLLQLVTGGRHHLVLIADAQAEALADALARSGAAAGLRLVERHRVGRVCQDLAAETFSRDVAARVRAVTRALPAG